ncbi:hypothetical protein GH733_010929 [Mirounga leonina]|nr:hypothetical protein GH733_010929 [Mirounga leonina]
MSGEVRLRQLEQFILDGPAQTNGQCFSVETLLDILICLYDECNNSPLRREKNILEYLEWAKPFTSKVKQMRLHREDFEILKVIGRGAFGEVAVVKLKNADKVFAMKILNKWEMLKRAEVFAFDFCSIAFGPWQNFTPLVSFIVTGSIPLYNTEVWICKNKYLVMDYYVGGDLLTLLSKFEDRLPEDMARFYLAEMVIAIDSVHQLHYVHRDIKPDNILMDMNGHIRLADFGSCLKLMEDGTTVLLASCSTVMPGLPYSSSTLLVPVPTLLLSPDELTSPCMERLMQAAFTRSSARSRLPASGPEHSPVRMNPGGSQSVLSHVSALIFVLSDRSCLRVTAGPASLDLDVSVQRTLDNNLATEAYERRIKRLEQEKLELSRKLQESTQTVQALQYSTADGPLTASKDLEIKTLKEEIEKLRKQVRESSHLEQQLEEANSVRRELDDTFRQVKAYEKQIKTLQQEREELNKELVQASERLKNQSKELKDAHCQRKLAMQEFMEINERLTELHTQKQKLARHVRDKEEEVDLLEVHTEAVAAEASKDRKLREQSEHYSKQLENELEGLKDMPWKMRRFAKLDMSARLELQSALDAEIRAKQAIQEELNKVKAANIITECKLKDSEKKNLELLSEIEQLIKDTEELRSEKGIQCDLNVSLAFCSPSAPPAPTNPSHCTPPANCPAPRPLHSEACINRREIDDIEDLEFESQQELTDPVENTYVRNPNVKVNIQSRSTSPSTSSEAEPVKRKTHQFFVKSFTTPTRCHQCTSLMVGLIRQGCSCEVCGFSCHITCVNKAPTACPVPPEQTKGPLGIDPQKGIGTAYEGHVRIPKPAGVKKGWQRALAVVCDFKLFLYDVAEGKASQPSVVVSQVIDMRDEEFSVSSVLASDVIHASRKDIPCIFRVTASQLSASDSRCSVLMLAESESERNKWVGMLSELHKILKKSKFRDRSVYVPKEAYDSTLPLIKTTQAAAIIDHERIALGNEEGLFVVHVTKDEIIRVGDNKKIHQIELIPNDQLVAVISGRNRHVRLFPMSALDGRETDFYKLAETKGCQSITSGKVCHGALTCLCVAMKRQVLCYELFQSKTRHRKFKEIQVPYNVQWMAIFSEQLCVGFQSGFLRYPLNGEGSPYSMLHSNDHTLSFIAHQPMDAICAVEISSKEYLLCFNSIGVYTDCQGRRSRQQELMWPANPSFCCYNAPYLSVYSENAVDIFDVNSMEWIQTLPLKKVRPLNNEGSLNLLGLETIRLIYFKNKMAEGDELVVPETSDNSRKQMVRNINNKRRFSFRVPEEERMQQRREMLRDPEMRNKLISNPTNFNHIAHMGPGDGIQILKDLPMNPRPQESRAVFSGSVSIPSITKSRPEPGRSMSASSGLSANGDWTQGKSGARILMGLSEWPAGVTDPGDGGRGGKRGDALG